MLFFFSMLLALGFVTADHLSGNQARTFSRIPEQTITYEQVSGNPQGRIIELAPSNNVLHLHFGDDFFNSGAYRSAPAMPTQTMNSGVSGTPNGSFMRRNSYVRPEVYSPVQEAQPKMIAQQYSNPIYRSKPEMSYSPQTQYTYPMGRTYYVPAQAVVANPNIIRIVPNTQSPMMQPNMVRVVASQPMPNNPYHFTQPNVIQRWMHQPATSSNTANSVIRIPTVVRPQDPKYTLVTINSPIQTDFPRYKNIFSSGGMKGSQNFNKPAVSARSIEPEFDVVRATSFSSKPSIDVRAPVLEERKVSQTAGGIIVHRLQETIKPTEVIQSAEPTPAVVSEMPKETTNIEMLQPTMELATPIEPAKVVEESNKPITLDVVSRNAATDGMEDKIEQTKEDPENSDDETLDS